MRNQVIRFYFLPENNDKFEDSLIDFNLVESILIKDFDKYKEICEIKSPGKEDIIASYASYCVRIGTKDYASDFLEKIMKKISNLKKEK